MKKVAILSSLFFVVLSSNAQQTKSSASSPSKGYKLNWNETFVIKVKFNKAIFEDVEKCLYANEKCKLYEIKIEKVLYYPEGSIIDSSTLANMKYIIAPAKYSDSLDTGKEFIITAKPSRSCNYLAFSKLYDQDFSNVSFYHDYLYTSGFQTCQNIKKDSFDSYITKTH